MEMTESKIEHWKSNIEELDASYSVEAIALKYRLLFWPILAVIVLPHARFKMNLLG